MFLRNPDIEEKENHGHYGSCLDRMKQIDRLSRKCFVYAAVSGIVMLFLTWMTFRMKVISFIPELIGDRASLAANSVQSLIIIAMAAAAFAAVVRYKIFDLLLFVIYSAMFILGAVSHSPDDILTLIIGVGGIIVSYKAPLLFLDSIQLKNTEGYPHFNERVTYQNEHKEFISRYEEEYHNNKTAEMSEAEAVPQTENHSSAASAEMDSL